jgi:hypothetical protein
MIQYDPHVHPTRKQLFQPGPQAPPVPPHGLLTLLPTNAWGGSLVGNQSPPPPPRPSHATPGSSTRGKGRNLMCIEGGEMSRRFEKIYVFNYKLNVYFDLKRKVD